jgi:eukaryotic-like serine/threonine-protein kinase
MTEQSPAEVIFFAALEKETAEERLAYLNGACGDDSNLRQRVERLLAAHPQVGNFLQPPAPVAVDLAGAPDPPPVVNSPAWSSTADTTDYHGPSEGVGSIIAGRYKLREILGQGGMGAVFMAQQTEPVKRLVALKLIKRGMDSQQVLTRFAAERQALALMDHPNIAKVLDAGATESGRPFFVMELVKGVPITRFCDERQLSPRERLELFIPVCHAIQHAHQKGVIHRDIKPTNVLVALYDDRPMPKVIDFGVAKATGSQLTDASLVTGFGAIVGTPEYMSPEQAQLNQLDIDTRSDVYALGVLLYELLTGTTPVDRKRLGHDALLEILRVIREEEPPRPSARLSTSETLASIAATRKTEPAALTRLLRGELDWIVMKCLEKERSRRYETANGLARDLERYLHDDVVEAQPPSAGYRVRKFYRKHRVGITTVSAFAGLLIAAAGISTLLAIKARRAELEATRNAHVASENVRIATAAQTRLADALQESKLTAFSLQIDSDLAEFEPDRRVGILRLARNVKAMSESDGELGLNDYRMSRWRALREFATMAVLANGQFFSTLLRPLSHDGYAIRMSFTSASRPRILTAGGDKTARLWDLADGKQIAILRRKDEKVLGAGLSPDGVTAFTDCSDGVVRLWETADGTFRGETDARPERVKHLDIARFDSFNYSQGLYRDQTQLSDNRVLIFERSWRLNSEKQNASKASQLESPVELWDAKTGRLLGRLQPRQGDAMFHFVGRGRWIVRKGLGGNAEELFRLNPERSLHIYSAEDGRPIAELKNADVQWLPDYISPSGRTMATFSSKQKGEQDALSDPPNNEFYVQLWDTTSWKPRSISGPFPNVSRALLTGIRLLTDDVFALDIPFFEGTSVIHPPTNSPVAVVDGPIMHVNLDRKVAMDQTGQLFDTRHWRRVQPPKGRRHHPDLAFFAPDSRFTLLPPEGDSITGKFIDSATDKTFELFYISGTDWMENPTYLPRTGWSMRWSDDWRLLVQRLPTLDHLSIPPDLLELWAQVAVRGQLDDGGTFVSWNESTWEGKRQELASGPVPYPDFPFPGYVAVDRFHWLRQEFESASGADKSRFARQLFDRANAVGDKAEAARWTAFLASELVESLGRTLILRADVERHLREDASLNPEVRAKALLRAGQLDEDAGDLNQASWRIAARANAEKDESRRALRWAEAAVRHEPDNSSFATTVGVLQYRNGRYRDAIATLTRSHETHKNNKEGPLPSNLAFLAMSHHAVSESEKAHDYLRQLIALCDQPRWKADETVTSFLKEARQRLALPP